MFGNGGELAGAAGKAGGLVRAAWRGAGRFLATRRKLRLFLYLFFGGAAALYLFAALVALNLDAETVRAKMVDAARKEGLGLSVGSLELSFPFAITMRNVRVDDWASASAVELDELRASVAVWRLILLHPSFSLRASSGGGRLAIAIAPGLFSANVTLSVKADAFPLDRAITKAGGAPLPLSAQLGGGGSFTFHPLSPAALEGSGEFRLDALSLKPGSQWAAFLTGFAPQRAGCTVAAAEKRLATKRCGIATTMGDFELRLGSSLINNLGASPLEGAAVLAPKGKLTDALALLYARFRKADGKYYFPVSGTLAAPALAL